MKIAFIGAGKVGCSLGLYFKERQVELLGYYSKSYDSALYAASLTKSQAFENLDNLVKKADLIFVSVSDNQIKVALKDVDKALLENKILCHLSGAMSALEGFEPYQKIKSIKLFSCHPLCAINSKEQSYKNLNEVFFFLEGSTDYLKDFQDFLLATGLKVKILKDSSLKAKYHLSATLVSNQVVALSDMAIDLLDQCGFSEDEAICALAPLMKYNLEQIISGGVVKALTGPVQRADDKTVLKHLNCFDDPNDQKLYALLSLKLLKIAKQKSPNCDFSKLNELLDTYIKD